VDALGDTALHAACRAQQWAVAELLVERGALQEVENEAGERPVAMGLGAAMRERGQEEEVKRQKVEQLREARRLVEEVPAHDANTTGSSPALAGSCFGPTVI